MLGTAVWQSKMSLSPASVRSRIYLPTPEMTRVWLQLFLNIPLWKYRIPKARHLFESRTR